LWDAVHSGHEEWGVPAYDGGLFSSDPAVSAAGGALGEIELTDANLGPALSALLVDEAPEGPGPADVRSLSVREFGTVSEGLLESSSSIAPSDLTIDTKGTYLPAKPGHEVLVGAGEVYFHNRSGVRKSTGSYFTKPFAVEHLLETALEPDSGGAGRTDPSSGGGDSPTRCTGRRRGDRAVEPAPPAGGPPLRLRRRSQRHRGGAGPSRDLDPHLRCRTAAFLPRSLAGGGRQPHGHRHR